MLFAEERLIQLDPRQRFIVYIDLAQALPLGLPRWRPHLHAPGPAPGSDLAWPNWHRINALPASRRVRELHRCVRAAPRICQQRADALVAQLVAEENTYRAARHLRVSQGFVRHRLARHQHRRFPAPIV